MSATATESLRVSGEAPADRRAEVLTAVDAIVDPCSRALGRPVGLVGMGMIERLDVSGGRVCVTVLPTFPTCLFRGVLEEEIEGRIRLLPWCEDVSVRFADAGVLWDESRLSDAARAALGRADRRAE
jgi:metal-sulfur cluster biosynthetic enzyme